MSWYYEMLISANCLPEHASIATALVSGLIVLSILRAFIAIFKR